MCTELGVAFLGPRGDQAIRRTERLAGDSSLPPRAGQGGSSLAMPGARLGLGPDPHRTLAGPGGRPRLVAHPVPLTGSQARSRGHSWGCLESLFHFLFILCSLTGDSARQGLLQKYTWPLGLPQTDGGVTAPQETSLSHGRVCMAWEPYRIRPVGAQTAS